MQLFEALKQDKPEAFAFIYRQYYGMVASLANNFGCQGAECEDLFQEVLIVLVRKLRDPEFELNAKLSTYLYSVARNLLLKKSNNKTGSSVPLDKVSPARLEDDSSADVLEEMTEREKMLNLVMGTLHLMEEDCRILLELSFFEKLPQAEIAEKMGYSVPFVKVKKFRCLEYLRGKVKEAFNSN